MNKRRYGGFIIHGGVVLVFVGIIASSFFNSEQLSTVRAGETFQVEDYTLRHEELLQRKDPEKEVVFARVAIMKNGREVGFLYPQKDFHFKSEQPATEVAIRSTFFEDLYVVLSGWDSEGNVTFHVFVNPLVQMIWLGIAIMALGGLFVLFPDKKPASAVRRKQKEVQDEAA